MVNVICIKWGTKYNGPYVNNLYSMVQRHLKRPHRFICFTDDPSGFVPGVEHFPIPITPDDKGVEPKTGWPKLSLLRAPLADLSGPALFLDLDVIVVGSLDELFEIEGDFFIARDFLPRPGRVAGNSSVFRFNVNEHPKVWTDLLADPEGAIETYRIEQNYLTQKIREEGKLQFWPEGWCVSFKRHCLPPTPINWFKTATIPTGAKVVVFHGTPKMDEAQNGLVFKARRVKPVPWIAEHWR